MALHTLHCGVQYHKPGIHSCTHVLLPVCLTPRFIPVWITPSKNNPAQLLDNEQNHAAADLVISEAECLWQVYSWEGKWKFFLAFVRSPVTPAAQVTTARGRQHLNNTKLSHITRPRSGQPGWNFLSSRLQLSTWMVRALSWTPPRVTLQQVQEDLSMLGDLHGSPLCGNIHGHYMVSPNVSWAWIRSSPSLVSMDFWASTLVAWIGSRGPSNPMVEGPRLTALSSQHCPAGSRCTNGRIGSHNGSDHIDH